MPAKYMCSKKDKMMEKGKDEMKKGEKMPMNKMGGMKEMEKDKMMKMKMKKKG